AILYLHGFALCTPAFYEAHLRQLASEGWIVLFPDFQVSAYREAPVRGPGQARGGGAADAPSRVVPQWGRTTRTLLRRRREDPLSREDLPEELKIRSRSGAVGAPVTALPDLQVGDLRRVLLPWLLIQAVLAVIGWFRRTYARNLGELIGTVLLSLAYEPVVWLRNGHQLAERALVDLAERREYAHWQTQPPVVYGFGHSLGGLLCLSLPALKEEHPGGRCFPVEILAADPATSTEMGIPGFAIALLRLFNAPFTSKPLNIASTGPKIDVPVTILHGRDDTIVPPQLWAVRGGQGAFGAVEGPAKALYFASGNPARDPSLVAFHNQAVTSTKTYDDALFASFGGVKHGPNAYNRDWIWPVVEALFLKGASPPNLLAYLTQERPFDVSTEPPPPQPHRWPWLLVALAIPVALVLAWWWRG
ncbi:MAG: hypothetical protein ACK5QW_03890, partial [Cyanobacteriota bacterium]